MFNNSNGDANIFLFGVNLKRIRREHGFTAEKLAEEVGVSTRIIFDYESGRKFPTTDRLVIISNVLCVAMDSFFHDC